MRRNEGQKCSSSISLKKHKDAIEDICMEHCHGYGCETWTIREAERKRLEAFEMSCYRRMRNIKCMDRITNGEVLRKKNLVEEEKRSDDGVHTHTHTH